MFNPVKKRFLDRGFSISLILLLFAGVLGFLSYRKFIQDAYWVEHAYQVTLSIRQLKYEMKEVESSRRGYILTRNYLYLKNYYQGVKEIQKNWEHLSQLIVNPSQKSYLRPIKSLIDQKLALLENSMELFKKDPTNRTQQVMITSHGQPVQEKLERELEEIEANELILLNKRSQKTTKSLIYNVIMIVSGYILSMVLLSLVYQDLFRKNRALILAQEGSQKFQKELEKTTQLYQAIMDSAHHLIVVTDLKGMIVAFNRSAEKMLGYKAEEVVGKVTPTLFHSPHELSQKFSTIEAEIWLKMMENKGKVEGEEWTYIRQDGGEFPVLLSMTSLQDSQGNLQGFLGICSDISEQKKYLDALRKREAEFKALVESSPDVVARIDNNLRHLYINPAIEKETGISPEMFLGKTLSEVGIPPETSSPIESYIHSVWREKVDQIFEFYLKNNDSLSCYQGRIIPEFNLNSPDVVDSVLIITRNITELKQAEYLLKEINQTLEKKVQERTEELEKTLLTLQEEMEIRREIENKIQRSNERYRSLVMATSQIVWLAYPNGETILEENEGWKQVTGQTYEELKNWGWMNAIHPEDRESVFQSWKESVENQKMFEKEYRLKISEGNYRDFFARGIPLLDTGGNIREWIGTLTDITEKKQSKLALIESQHQYETLAKCVPVGIFRTDLEGICLYVNQHWYDITGLSLEEAKRGWSRSLHPQDRLRILTEWEEFIKSKNMFLSEYRFVNKQQIIWVLGQAIPEKDREGNVIGYVGTITDITQRKKIESELQKSEELYRTLARNFPNGAVHLFDENLRFTLSDGLGLAEMNLTPEQFVGKTLGEVVPPDLEKILDPLYRLALQGELRSTDMVFVGKFYRVYTLPIKNELGEIIGGMAMSQNINAQKQIESILTDARNTLEILVQERTEELGRLNQSLKAEIEEKIELTNELTRSNEELEQFAYVASHDLQEPLRAITGYTQLLEMEYKQRLDGEALEYMEFMVEGAKRMQQLIQDLLIYSRVGTRGQNFQDVDLSEIIQQVLTILKLTITEKQAMITCESLPKIMADPIQMIQLYQNLISNALKFCQDQPPQIRLGAELKTGYWLFFVKDNGIGIKPQYFERIFIIFKRLHTRTEFPGTGIGLAVCKKIVERHGGKIWVESEVGVGTTFFFTIPLTSGVINL